MINETHAPQLASWVPSANASGSNFPLQNLPHGVFRRRGSGEAFRGGVAIGEMILDMPAACAAGAFDGAPADAAHAAGAETLNGLMAMGAPSWSALRLRLSQVLREGAPQADALRGCLVPQADAEFAVPAQIGDYTDFFTSWHHMMNAGRIFQRDVQGLESLPLGPFLAKNFITSISPWIVTLEALAPFRCALPREPHDPPAPAHLQPGLQQTPGAFDIQLEVGLRTARMAALETRLSRTSFRHCHWSLAQMIAHHAEGGCNLRPGDLMGTGTQSGPGPGEQGCLLELSRAGQEPVRLANGETRGFLEDGDTVVLRGWCEREGFRRIGFGECTGTVLPSLPARGGAIS